MLLKTWRVPVLVAAPALIAVAGCGGRVSAFSGLNSSAITIHAATSRVDTSRTIRYTATMANGETANVAWSVAGGDPSAGAGSITADGVYTPPSYLTRDSVTVAVKAVAAEAASESDAATNSATLIVTPGFLQPLTPGNLSLGASSTATISASMAEVGGSGGIRFSLASDAAGTPGGAGTLSAPDCVRGSIRGGNPAYTVCSVIYTAPTTVAASESVYVIGKVARGDEPPSGSAGTISWSRVLLNAAGISSNPAAHQAHLAVPVMLGSSSGNNSDYDTNLGQLSDCCGGTLGALVQDASGNRYVLSNDHVLARSDQSTAGETIIQPGLIDNGCTPYGFGPGTTPVASLTGYPAMSSPATNVDAAIARVSPAMVDAKGSILELGAKQQDGTLAAAPPGISSSNGRGEPATLGMMVAKSGRTTGLTCAAVSAVNVDVVVDYFSDCAETEHAMTKTFTNQIAIAGTNFSDAGDSGALVVDTANAEPVGLFFAGGTDANGVEQAIANPAGEVLAALDAQVPGVGGQTSYSFAGGADHPVSCVSYDAPKSGEEALNSLAISATERERVEAGVLQAQSQLFRIPGVQRIGAADSRDVPGEGAIAIYVDGASNLASSGVIPPTIGGVTTLVLTARGGASEAGSYPGSATLPAQPRPASLSQVVAVKRRNAAVLMKSNPAIFGVGVGQSVNNPNDSALMLFVDRKKNTGSLPSFIEGQRVRVVLMDRLHVTRSHGQASRMASTCLAGKPHVENSPEERLPNPFQDELRVPQ